MSYVLHPMSYIVSYVGKQNVCERFRDIAAYGPLALTTQLGFRSKWRRTCQYTPLHICVLDKCVNVVEK